jgi:ANTAR domain
MTSDLADKTLAIWSDADAERLQLENMQLQWKLASQPVIEQAKGMLMQAFGLCADDAFEVIKLISQNCNVKVRHVAQRIVDDWICHGPRPDYDCAVELLLTVRHDCEQSVA